MKIKIPKTISFLLLFFILPLVCPLRTSAQPWIIFSEDSFNFGEMPPNQKVEHIFTFKNSGDKTLIIDSVSTSCGCAVAILSNKSLKPGESGEIKVTFDSTNRTGKQHKIIYVNSNDPTEGITALNIYAFVKIDLEVFPSNVYFFRVDRGQTVSKEVTIKNVNHTSCIFSSIETSSPSISFTINSEKAVFPITLKPEESLTINISVEAPKDKSRLYGQVVIKTNNPHIPQIIIPVTLIAYDLPPDK